jgi:carbonic anhydrase/acetyltransferase-like protein (isoleucine patch superfamily)
VSGPRLLRVGRAFVASTASVTGDVVLGEDVSLWYGVVVRGDDARVVLGARSNVQDNAVVHVDVDTPTEVAQDVTIGHAAIVHGARVERYALIGMGSILLSGCVVREGAIVAAGALVREGFEVPAYSLAVGVPAKVVRGVGPDERRRVAIEHAAGYVARAREHADGVWLGRVRG